ncbi:hypothetical protein G7Y89_g9901 [Cudoniella acicularis]|uniref:Clr5 domain-containing protein n=1 Tax=Cudoniella acicularis TaxID=354080 RepID=A0A8H4RG31_9HELO|nr:hypothetical protein G7Y89_g9901 [Cudoniella acicularis]
MSLEDVMAKMNNDYGFTATKRQYNRRISQWGLDKNIKDSEVRWIAQKQKRRAVEEKDTVFKVRGREVDPDRIARAIKWKRISDEVLLSNIQAATPEGVTYNTPLVVDAESPHIPPQSPQSPRLMLSSPIKQMYAEPILNIERPGQSSFLVPVPPECLPTTPARFGGLHAFSSPTDIFRIPQSPFQFSTSLLGTAVNHESLTTGAYIPEPKITDDCENKRTRLLEVVRETERNESIDYMKTMPEVNSLEFNIIQADRLESQRLSWESLHGNIHIPNARFAKSWIKSLHSWGEEVRKSPRLLWKIIPVILSAFVEFSGLDGPIRTILGFIIQLGTETLDRALYFWMAVFISALLEAWEIMFNFQHGIIYAAKTNLFPGTRTIELSLLRLNRSPWRISEASTASSDGPYEAFHHSLSKIGDIHRPVKSLEELGMVLIEVSLKEIEQVDNPEAMKLLQQATDVQSGEQDCITWSDILNARGEDFEYRDDMELLCLAAKAGHLRTAKALIEAGADPSGMGENSFQNSPIELTRNAGHDDVVSMLIKHGA